MRPPPPLLPLLQRHTHTPSPVMWHATPAAAAQSFFGLTVQEVCVWGWGGAAGEKKKSDFNVHVCSTLL